ncbi:MAG: uracil-DNA glycosylase [Oscillospiraceae bacterium]|nr:uracil-DNA glycosylase [Oscillospiraceae bacterium]
MITWEQLEYDCKSCRRCALAETRTNVVFGTGSRNAEVLFVGEGPGRDEDLKGEPFVGRAGKLLDEMLAVIGLDRTKIYIANMVKCRPPDNRDPLNIEQDECIGWLRSQTALLNPKIIVALGRVAAARLIRPDLKITAEHGRWVQKKACWMTAIYHPAYLLRDGRKKPETYEDLRSIENKIRELCTNTELE